MALRATAAANHRNPYGVKTTLVAAAARSRPPSRRCHSTALRVLAVNVGLRGTAADAGVAREHPVLAVLGVLDRQPARSSIGSSSQVNVLCSSRTCSSSSARVQSSSTSPTPRSPSTARCTVRRPPGRSRRRRRRAAGPRPAAASPRSGQRERLPEVGQVVQRVAAVDEIGRLPAVLVGQEAGAHALDVLDAARPELRRAGARASAARRRRRRPGGHAGAAASVNWPVPAPRSTTVALSSRPRARSAPARRRRRRPPCGRTWRRGGSRFSRPACARSSTRPGRRDPPERPRLELAHVLVLAGHVAEPVLRVPRRHRALELRVARRLVRMRAQEVADGQVPALMVAPGLADVEVVRPRPLGRLAEEAVVGHPRVRHEDVAEARERAGVGVERLERRDGELEVQDRLRGQPGDRRGADMLEPHRQRAEHRLDAAHLVLRAARPRRVGLDDADRGIELAHDRFSTLRRRALRRRRRPLPPRRQDRRDPGLRLPGTRAFAQPQGLGGRRRGRPARRLGLGREGARRRARGDRPRRRRLARRHRDGAAARREARRGLDATRSPTASRPATCCCSATASRSTTTRSTRPPRSTSGSSRRRAPATSCAASTSRRAASPA